MFGVADAQRAQVVGFVDTAHDLFFRTQMIGATGAQPLPEPDLPAARRRALAGSYSRAAPGSTSPRSARSCCCWCAPAPTGRRAGRLPGRCASRCRSSSACRTPSQRYADSARRDGDVAAGGASQTLAFEEVSFAYTPERPVLTELSFEVAAAKSIGIVGPSGAGKSTLVQILLQLRPPTRGQLPGQRRAGRAVSRARTGTGVVAYVPQEPRLLHASVADNIRFFRDLDDEAVERAARLARIHDDIVGWPDGYDDDRRAPRRRRLRRPAAAHLPGARARRAPGGARARRAHERAGPPLGEPDPGVAERAQATS